MTEAEGQDNGEVSAFALGTPLLRNRWRIVRWTFVGTAIAALMVFQRPALYLASASFYPQNAAPQSGLLSTLGQFGLTIPSGGPSQSPEFYQVLLKSRVLWESIALDTLVVEELGGERLPFLEFFEIEGGSERSRIDDALELLSGMVSTPTSPRNTSLVLVTAATEWPSVSLFIVTALVDGVNAFNANLVQGQAGAERVFVEGRLELVTTELRDAEDDLESFLENNRQFGGSPELNFQQGRLERSVTLRQEVFTTLTQTLEEVRIREVRDIPVISVVDQPFVPSLPEPRGRGVFVVLGFLTGGFIGVLLSLVSEALVRLRQKRDSAMEEFVVALEETRDEFLTPVAWLRRRLRG